MVEKLKPNIDTGEPYDVSLHDLDPEKITLIEQKSVSWFSSYGFACLYPKEPAHRATVIQNANGEIDKIHYYQEDRWLLLGKRLTWATSAFVPDTVLLHAMKLRHAHIATISPVPLKEATLYTKNYRGCSIQHLNDDYIIDLPDTTKEYIDSLGSQTRKHLPYYLRRINREFGDKLRTIILSDTEISMDLVSGLVELNAKRLVVKGSKSLWDANLIEKRCLLAQKGGVFFGLEIDGRLAAGTLSYCYGGEYYLALIGHDPAFNRLELGLVCLWQMIEYLIKRHVHRYHLLWGRSFYKMQLGAKECPLHTVTIYRSGLIFFLESASEKFLEWQSFLRDFPYLANQAFKNTIRQTLNRFRNNEDQRKINGRNEG